MDELLNLDSATLLVSIVLLSAVVIISLGFIIVYQRKEIKDLKRPKYGFLGKPLNVLLIAVLLAGGYGLFQFTAINGPTETTDISADQNVTLEVTATEVNPEENIYRLKAIPSIDGTAYGDVSLDIYWTITSEGGATITEIETGVSRENPSDLVVTLPSGNTTINANIFTSSTDFVEREIRVLVE